MSRITGGRVWCGCALHVFLLKQEFPLWSPCICSWTGATETHYRVMRSIFSRHTQPPPPPNLFYNQIPLSWKPEAPTRNRCWVEPPPEWARPCGPYGNFGDNEKQQWRFVLSTHSCEMPASIKIHRRWPGAIAHSCVIALQLSVHSSIYPPITVHDWDTGGWLWRTWLNDTSVWGLYTQNISVRNLSDVKPDSNQIQKGCKTIKHTCGWDTYVRLGSPSPFSAGPQPFRAKL